MTKDHHWVGTNPNPTHYFGFIYIITDCTTGKQYVGKKQYWIARRIKGCKSKVSDRQSPKWKPTCWKESDWRTYKGSSKNLNEWMELNPGNDYEYRIVRQCRTKGTLHYAEVEALVRTGSLWKRDEDEEPMYFNRQIPATRFRPPVFYGDEEWLAELE